MQKKLRLVVLVCASLAILGYWWNQHRHVRVSEAVNPAYWVRRWQGKDLYDPQTHLLSHGNRSLPEVALTIDDAPNQHYTGRMLDTLKAESVHATFFLIGEDIKKAPALVRRMVSEGHEVGNHSQDHLRLDTLTDRQVRNEIVDCDINFDRVTGKHLALLRPPGMRSNDTVVRVATGLHYTIVGYSWGARDYQRVSPEALVDEVGSRVENGSIIILHDEYPESAEALGDIIREFKAAGYRFVTVTEMLADLPKAEGTAGGAGMLSHEMWQRLRDEYLFMNRRRIE